MRERLIKLSSKIIVLLLAFVMVFGFDLQVSYAGPQEDVDSGFVSMTSNTTLTLRGGEVYYVALRGGIGGSGGGGMDCHWVDSLSNWYHYMTGRSGGGTASVVYFKLEPSKDVQVNFAVGKPGGSGGYTYFANDTYTWYSVPAGVTTTANNGGSGGANGISAGSNGSSGSSSRAYAGSDGLAGAGGGGGGGGGASAMYFNGNTSYVISASGGNGGSGAQGLSKVHFGEKGYTYWYRAYGGYGGSGGSIPMYSNLSAIPNVVVTAISNTEGAARVDTPNVNGGASIKKELVIGDKGVPVTDLSVNSHIVLSNSVNNASAIFKRWSAIDLNFTFVSGLAYVPHSSAVRAIEWHDFSKYAVSGSGSGPSTVIRVKEDLMFLGGDGSAISPYYPEVAGSIVVNGDGGGGSNQENTEKLSNSIVSVGSQIESLLTYQKEADEKMLNAMSANLPFTVSCKVLNGALATKSTNIPLSLKVDGRKMYELTYSLSINGGENSAPNTIPPNNIINVSGLVNGLNTIVINVRDQEGDYRTDVVNIWRL